MAATTILDFKKFAYMIQGINTSWYLVYAVKSLGKALHSCGNYYNFSKFKMAAAATLDLEKFAYMTQGINSSWYKVYAVKIW